MRILILHSRYLSGAASGENRVVEDEARLLRDAGHQVHVWAPSAEGARGLSLARTGARTVWSRQAAEEVRGLIRHNRSEIVHLHNLFPALSPAVARAAGSAGAAVVMTLHNYRLLCLSSLLLRNGQVCEDCVGRRPWPGVLHGCYRGSRAASAAVGGSLTLHRSLTTFDRIRLFLAVSQFVRDKHVEAGLAPSQIRVKSNFAWPSPRREGSGEYFLYLGRLSPEKGVATLLRAWKGSPGRLLVVGDGPDAEELKAIAPSSVEFLGLVPFTEVPNLLRRARALLVPSLSYDASPRTVLEAYAAGVPVLASRMGGLPELVVDGVSGLLLSPHVSSEWAQAAERLLDDREAHRLGEQAWQLWAEHYSPERGLKNLEDCYQEALRS